MLINVSIGEVVDRITILEIKQERISDASKLADVKLELGLLQEELDYELNQFEEGFPEDLKRELKEINEKLWDAEDVLRRKESQLLYDEEFIKCAVLDSELNDVRFLVKNRINNHFGSQIKEHKSYDHLRYETK